MVGFAHSLNDGTAYGKCCQKRIGWALAGTRHSRLFWLRGGRLLIPQKGPVLSIICVGPMTMTSQTKF